MRLTVHTSILIISAGYFSLRTQSLTFFFFFNDTATTEIYTLSLHDALPIYHPPVHGHRQRPLLFQVPGIGPKAHRGRGREAGHGIVGIDSGFHDRLRALDPGERSEEHTSELQSHSDLVCRLLLEKKKKNRKT